MICYRCYIDRSIDGFVVSGPLFHSIQFQFSIFPAVSEQSVHYYVLFTLSHTYQKCDWIDDIRAQSLGPLSDTHAYAHISCYGRVLCWVVNFISMTISCILLKMISLDRSRSCSCSCVLFTLVLVRLEYRWIKCTVINFVSIIFSLALAVSISFVWLSHFLFPSKKKKEIPTLFIAALYTRDLYLVIYYFWFFFKLPVYSTAIFENDLHISVCSWACSSKSIFGGGHTQNMYHMHIT